MDALVEPDEAPELKRQRQSAGMLNEMAAEDVAGVAPGAIPLRPATSADEAALRRAAGQKNMDRCAERVALLAFPPPGSCAGAVTQRRVSRRGVRAPRAPRLTRFLPCTAPA